MKLKTLQNLSRDPQVMSFEGEIVRFEPAGAPGAILDLPEAVADLVIEHLGGLVRELGVDVPIKSYVDVVRPESCWLANMTGDPDAPSTVLVTSVVNKKTGEREPVYEPNEKKEPRTVVERMGVSHEFYTTQSGTGQRAIPQRPVIIAPYQRVEVKVGERDTIVNRDATKQAHQRGRVIMSRPPADFEPKQDWTLDELRAWVILCDPLGEMVAGPSEAELRAQCEEANKTEEQTYLILHKAKTAAWQRAILRVLNPKYRLVSKKEFEAYMGRQIKAAKEKAPAKGAKAAKSVSSEA